MPKLPADGSFSKSLYQSEKDKTYLVVKENQIVQNTHYTMPLADQKVLASLIRSIKPGQNSLKIKFSTRKYMKMLGMRWSGTTFSGIMYTLKHIADDSFYIKHRDGSYDLWRWIEHVHANPNGHGKGDFIVKFPKELKPYLFNSQLRYKTIYKFSDIMLMRSRYSPRLYEIFRSNQSRQKIQKRGLNYSISELKYMLNLMYRDKRTHKIKHNKDGKIKFKYPSYYEFKRNVLRPSCREINRFTEYNLKMKPIHHHGRKTIGINVVITHKNQKQITKRDDLIYCITHHIPKSQWKSWRESKIKGTFHRIHPRKNKSKHVVDGKFHVIKKNKTSNKNIDIKNYLNKHPIPMKEINMSGGKVEFYSPLVHRYVWTKRSTYYKQLELYHQQQEMVKEMDSDSESK